MSAHIESLGSSQGKSSSEGGEEERRGSNGESSGGQTDAMMNNGLTNGFIKELLEKYCEDFEGVYNCGSGDDDAIPMQRLSSLERYSIVFNLSAANRSGISHFVTILVSNYFVHYVDPLNLPIRHAQINRFIEMVKRDRVVSTHYTRGQLLQLPESDYSGFFAIAFALHFDMAVLGKPAEFPFFQRVWNEVDSDRNEIKCLQVISQMLFASRHN